MQLLSLPYRLITPTDDLLTCLLSALTTETLHNGDILVITSKVVAVTEGRIADKKDEAALMRSEADLFFGGDPEYPLALKNGHLTAKSGIDRSNAPEGSVILWPRDPWLTAEHLRAALLARLGLTDLGIIICDSFCRPLRQGVVSEAISFAGFIGIHDMRASTDIYGKQLMITQTATADALAAAAGVLMGDAAECIPFVLIRGAPVTYANDAPRPKLFPPRTCLFAPLYSQEVIAKIEHSGIPMEGQSDSEQGIVLP